MVELHFWATHMDLRFGNEPAFDNRIGWLHSSMHDPCTWLVPENTYLWRQIFSHTIVPFEISVSSTIHHHLHNKCITGGNDWALSWPNWVCTVIPKMEENFPSDLKRSGPLRPGVLKNRGRGHENERCIRWRSKQNESRWLAMLCK